MFQCGEEVALLLGQPVTENEASSCEEDNIWLSPLDQLDDYQSTDYNNTLSDKDGPVYTK